MTLTLLDLLASYYQSRNFECMEAISHTMLAAVPNDTVAMQFLGLSLYMKGRGEEAKDVFQHYAKVAAHRCRMPVTTSCESAADANYRAAIRPGSGLSHGWRRISQIFTSLGYVRHAARAQSAAILSDDPICIAAEQSDVSPGNITLSAKSSPEDSSQPSIQADTTLQERDKNARSTHQLEFGLDVQGVILNCGGNTESLLGYRPAELHLCHVSRVIPRFEGVELYRHQRLNTRLAYLCHIGNLFELRHKMETYLACTLTLVDLGNHEAPRLRVIGTLMQSEPDC